jgi:MFS family permease
VPALIITVGVIGGFGASLVFIPANIAIGYYFENKRALATGIAHCGSGVGQLIIAPPITFLSNTYSWKIVILIIAGFCLTCAILGALIRPLEVMEKVFKTRHETKIFQPSSVLRKHSTNEEYKQVARPLLDEKKENLCGPG